MSELAPANTPRQVVESWTDLEKREGNKFVSVNYDALDDLAAQNPDLAVPDWKKYFENQHPQNDWAFASQIVVANTINYMFLNRDIESLGESWTMHDSTTGKQLSGSVALMTRLYQRFGETEDVTAEQLEVLASEKEFEAFLPGIPMGESRRQQLVTFAAGLRGSYQGSVRNLLEASVDSDGGLRIFNDGAGLVDRLLDDGFGGVFKDENIIGELSFPHNKRANLTGILVYGRAVQSTDLPKVTDIDMSGAVPDYRLPQALRASGEIVYAASLAKLVDNWVPIEKGSQMEAEIRGATARAAFYLLEKTNDGRTLLQQEPYNMAHVDYWLWKKGRDLKHTNTTSLPHYTETTAY